jgi:carbonic anhydrase
VSHLPTLLAANRRYAERFALGGLPARPRLGLAILTCMDARIDPLALLGLAPGDAHVIRNAGGRVSADALRSLLVSTAVLGVREVLVLHHTGCGMIAEDPTLRGGIRSGGGDPAGLELLAMPDPDAALREDVWAIRSSPRLPAGIVVSGARYDVASGLVQQVLPPGAAAR